MYEILCAGRRIWRRTEYGIKTQAEETVPVCNSRFLRESGRIENAKQILDVESQTGAGKRGYARQLTSFAKMIQYTTRELDAGIFQDDHLEEAYKGSAEKRKCEAAFGCVLHDTAGKI